MNTKSNLSPELLEKASLELGEDESKRTQMLEQFRAWIKNHPHIKNCRQDDIFLLRFLRAKKFSFMNATSMLESYLTAIKLLPQYFSDVDIENPIIRELIDSGFILGLPERDKDGSRILMIRSAKVDVEKYTSADVIKTAILLIELFLDEEQTQVCGGKLVIDFTDTSMKFFGLFSLVDLKNITTLAQKISAIRQKGYYLINLPSAASTIVQFILNLLSEKLRKRTHFVKNANELKNHLDTSIIPVENGGTKNSDEIIKHMKMRLMDERKRILMMKDDDIVISKAPSWANSTCVELENGVIGSFRKLEVD